jgi:hypothetical protein
LKGFEGIEKEMELASVVLEYEERHYRWLIKQRAGIGN